MAQLFKCYVCEQYFDQYGLELHFVMTHKMDDEEEEENPSTAESDQGFVLLNFYCNKNAIIANIQ